MIYNFKMQNECLDNIHIHQKLWLINFGSYFYVSKNFLNLTIINHKNFHHLLWIKKFYIIQIRIVFYHVFFNHIFKYEKKLNHTILNHKKFVSFYFGSLIFSYYKNTGTLYYKYHKDPNFYILYFWIITNILRHNFWIIILG